MNYKVIVTSSGHELTKKVNEYLNDGWRTDGSHHVVVKNSQNRFSGNQHKDTVNELEYSQTMYKIINK